MPTKKNDRFSFKNSLKLLFFSLITPVCLVGSIFLAYFLQLPFDQYTERQIARGAAQEVAQIPGVRILRFMPWEGDSLIDIEIEDKGKVKFWYGKNGVPRIWEIGPHTVDFTCFFVDGSGQRERYAYNQSLILDDQSKFDAWVPIRARSITELIERYDEIVESVAKFPEFPRTGVTKINDQSGIRDVIVNPDPNFVLHTELNGRKVSCDLYR
jgi:hypothetical protein